MRRTGEQRSGGGRRWLVGAVAATVVLTAAMGGRMNGLASTADVNEPSWRAHVFLVDQALDAGDIARAERAWQAAYGAALRSRQWEAMLAVGKAVRRMEHMTRLGPTAARARTCYLSALFRAREQGSLDGVIRATEAFAALGDWEMVRPGIFIARGVAGHDKEAGTLVDRFAVRLRQAYGSPAPADRG